MSAVDLHPEELIERGQRGQLTADERARLDSHCAVCEACAMERLLAGPLEPDAADVALVEGLLDDVLEASAPAPNKARTPWLAVAASVAVLVLTFGGGAYAAVRFGWVPNPLAEQPSDAPEVSRPRERPAPVIEEPAVEAPVAEAPPVDEGAQEPRPPGPRPRQSAEELYAQANAARRSGEHARALALYRTLTRQYPGSRQARTAQVAAGNLALHELHNPRAALRHFDRYLASSPSGPLALEARVGRALALQRLSRRGPERRAWQAILEHHPTSVHAERARRRLEELR